MDTSPPGPAPAQAGRPAPRRRRWPVVLGVFLLVLAVLAAVLVPVAWRILRARPYVLDCFVNTGHRLRQELALAGSRLGLAEVYGGLRTGPVRQQLYLGTPGDRYGLEVKLDTDLPRRLAAAGLALQTGRVPVYTFAAQAQDDLLAVSAPQLLAGSYGVHTAALGADFNQSGIAHHTGLALDEDFGFDLFELLAPSETAPARATPTLATLDGLLRLWRQARELAGARYTGREDVTVNGVARSCLGYELTLARPTAAELLDGAAALIRSDPFVRSLLGLPAGVGQAGGRVQALADGLAWAADALAQDVQIQVFIRDDTVALLRVETRLHTEQGTGDFLMEAQLGGEHALADALRLYVEFEGAGLTLEVAGNHTGRQGEFSSGLVLSGRVPGQPARRLADASLWFAPAPAGENFTFQARLAGVLPLDVRLGGAVRLPGDGTLAATLERVELELAGAQLALHGEYSITPARAAPLFTLQPVMLLEQTDLSLLRLLEAVNWRHLAALFG